VHLLVLFTTKTGNTVSAEGNASDTFAWLWQARYIDKSGNQGNHGTQIINDIISNQGEDGNISNHNFQKNFRNFGYHGNVNNYSVIRVSSSSFKESYFCLILTKIGTSLKILGKKPLI